jgi:hypothetical protein
LEAAALLGLLLLVLLASQFLGGPLAAYAVGVVGIEVGAMFAGVGDMVRQTRQPLQRVHALEVAAERRIHPGSIQRSLLAIEVDELLEPAVLVQGDRQALRRGLADGGDRGQEGCGVGPRTSPLETASSAPRSFRAEV